MWYRAGSVSVTNGSTTVTGSGTNWIDGAAVGEGFWGPDNRIYEIAAIISATQITLGTSYQGSTAGGQTYQIVPSQSYIKDLAAEAAALVNNYATALDNVAIGKFSDGTLAAPGIRFTADENVGMRRVGADNLALVTGGTDRVSVSNSGVSVTGNATVNAGADSRVLLQVDGTTQAQFQATASAIRLSSNNATALALATNGVDRATLDSVGNVTFGAPGASGVFKVQGNNAGDLVVFESTDTSATAAPDVVLYRNSASPAAADQVGNLLFRGKDSGGADQSYARILATIVDPTAGAEVGDLRFGVQTTGGFSDLMTLASTGLSVTGGLTLSGSATLDAGTANGVLYLNGSKVLTTGSALTFDGSTLTNTGAVKFGSGVATNTSRLMINNATNTATGIQLFQDGIESWIMGMAANSAGLAWSASGSEQMRLTSTGLGIGTSSPATKLHVNTGAAGYGITVAALSQTSITYQFGIDSSSNLAIYDTAAAAQRVVLSPSGNLGLGVTPSGHLPAGYGGPMLQVGGRASILGSATTSAYTNNTYYAAGFFRYIGNDEATMLEQIDGQFRFHTAPSGTTGNAISFTQAMTLDASGNLGIGTSAPNQKLEVRGTIRAGLMTSSVNGTVLLDDSYSNTESLTSISVVRSSGGLLLGHGVMQKENDVGFVSTQGFAAISKSALLIESGNLVFLNAPAASIARGSAVSLTERLRIDSSGNLGIGTSSPGYKLDVFGGGRFQASNFADNVLRLSTGASTVGNLNQILFSDQLTSVTAAITAYNSAYGSSKNYALGFTTNGSERMLLDSSGNLGLGVTPSAWNSSVKAFQFSTRSAIFGFSDDTHVGQNVYYDSVGYKYIATSGAASNYRQTGGAHAWFTAPSGTAGNAISFTQAMTLDASGNLGVGQTANSARLHVKSSGQSVIVEGTAARGGGNVYGSFFDPTGRKGYWGYGGSTDDFDIANELNGGLRIYTNDTERARITSGGDLLVGTTDASQTSGAGFKVGGAGGGGVGQVAAVDADSTNSTVTYRLYSTGAAAYRFYVGLGGTIYATSATITSLSDQRLKENIQNIDVGLDAVMALKPRKFDWKAGKGKDKKNDRGWIAQEFEQVFPDMVDTWQDPAPEGEEPYKAVNADLIPVLVKAIQEQQALITDLRARVAALESN